jgi:ubiquinol-cytochrome c reductase cytochrome b subunit
VALEYCIAPVANRLPYMLGGLTFFGIVLLVVTGILMDQYYNPTPVGAHDSILYLMTRVPLGNWLRALHYWGATVVLVTVVLHLAYVFWRRSYLRPREVTLWVGVALFITLFGLVFTGTVLRTDQEGSEALAHAVAGARLVGALGAPLTPEFTQGAPLLTRLHNAHVSLLPLVLFALVGLHFWLVRYLGIHAHEPATVPFTHHLRRLTGYALFLVALLGTLAALVPPGIGYPGIEGVEVTKPFWPFLWIYTVENIMGLWGMIPRRTRGNNRGGGPRWHHPRDALPASPRSAGGGLRLPGRLCPNHRRESRRCRAQLDLSQCRSLAGPATARRR